MNLRTFFAFLIYALFGALVEAAPVVRWDFSEEGVSRAVAVGSVQRDVAGPRPPLFPDFESNNTAIYLPGDGARLVLADPGVTSPFDFDHGDELTLEAWVNLDGAQAGPNVYIIGKGRTGEAGFASDNQNWALRLRSVQGNYAVSFLFATPRDPAAKARDAHWHRWTTNSGFAAGSGWHHVAVSYRFGEPESIRGWIDGRPLAGAWDMGGATKQRPVMDDDAIWIGSSMKGSASASLRGSLDALAIHREILSDSELKSRYRRAGGEDAAKQTPAVPQVMPELGPLPVGRVLATFYEGLPAHDRWLKDAETLPAETTRWLAQDFLLPRLPVRYDDWGIRASWKAPVMARLAADVKLPRGEHRVVVRARGLTRMWYDGTLVLTTRPHKGDSGGYEDVTPVPPPPLPGLRSSGFGMQEVVGKIKVDNDAPARVVVETMIGGKRYRPEPGEFTVAVETADGRSFSVLQPDRVATEPLPLTDDAVAAGLHRIEDALAQLDDASRRTMAATQAAFWKQRHRLASEWATQQPEVVMPAGEAHPVDSFIRAKVVRVQEEQRNTPATETALFHEQVLPVLRESCFRCHGEKVKGGLKLDSLASALQGGDSHHPAIVPGKAAESELVKRLKADDEDERMPPNGDPLSAAQIAAVETWINAGAKWPSPPISEDQVAFAAVSSDASFLRRVYMDTIGLPPSEEDTRAFLADGSDDKRVRVIDRLLADDRWADHWVSYWQDVLAENPSMLKPSLNNTGPFRWYLYEALRDHKPMDQMVTELILLRGSEREGGSAGFGLAADNDAPFAAKGHIVATAFLGIELQCARCHDSPYHSTLQRDLYSLAAFFERKPVTVPASSTVPAAFFEKKSRESLIKVTLKPKELIAPLWPFESVTGVADGPEIDRLMQTPGDPRERLAALVTAPQNTRFAQVIVNRVWKRLMGAGLVEPAQDWEGRLASHPEMLSWLGLEFVKQGYDVRALARLIMTSTAYQREARGRNLTASAEHRFFTSPDPRRLSAEQVVDTLFAVAGQSMQADMEELTLDADARRPADSFISLGTPRRSWMLASLSNERDRPSLNLPRAQAAADMLEAFGWTGSRQNPRTDRESEANVLQPGVLANSILSTSLTRAAEGSDLARLAVEATSVEALTDRVFLRFFSRYPTAEEKRSVVAVLTPGFAQRVIPANEVKLAHRRPPLPMIAWSNHLMPEANSVKLELEQRVREGPAPDPRLRAEWREVFEDVVWGLVNTREFVWLP